MSDTELSELLLQEELIKTKKIKTENIVVTKKDAKLIILFMFLTLPLLAYYVVNDSQSKTLLNKLTAQLDQLISTEKAMGEHNKMTLTPVTYDVGEVMGDKEEDCKGLIMSVDDVVFCQSIGI